MNCDNCEWDGFRLKERLFRDLKFIRFCYVYNKDTETIKNCELFRVAYSKKTKEHLAHRHHFFNLS